MSVQKDYLDAETPFEDSSLEKESSKIQTSVDPYGQLKRTNTILEEITYLIKRSK